MESIPDRRFERWIILDFQPPNAHDVMMNTMHDFEHLIQSAAELIRTRQPAVAFTGAGISVESGIPTFRGPGGLWERVDPIFIELGYFHSKPKQSWEKIRDIFYAYFDTAEPNDGHRFLARLEESGMLEGVITQNIDNLHQDAGSKTVIEFHGNSQYLTCTGCGKRGPFNPTVLEVLPPTCACGSVLKPDFIFFGEMIPHAALTESDRLARSCNLMIVVGTTGEIYPAAQLPLIARQNGATLIEINPDPSLVTPFADVFLPMKATEAGIRLTDALGLRE